LVAEEQAGREKGLELPQKKEKVVVQSPELIKRRKRSRLRNGPPADEENGLSESGKGGRITRPASSK